MNREIEHQRRCDRDSTILGLAYIGLFMGVAAISYYYADYLNKNDQQTYHNQLEIKVQGKYMIDLPQAFKKAREDNETGEKK